MTQRHLPEGRINPVTYAPMPASLATVYRVGFYDTSGDLVKHQEAWPEMDNPTLQMVADISAAGHQAKLVEGTVVAWEDVDTEAPAHLPMLGKEGMAWRDFGPSFPPVPLYRFEVDSEKRTIMAFPRDES